MFDSGKNNKQHNHQHAHKLDKKDPQWLHEKEVDKVKVVLCRYSLSLARSLARSLTRSISLTLHPPHFTDMNSPKS